MKRIPILILSIELSLFNKTPKKHKFWNWFSKHQEIYVNKVENLEIREKIFNDLSTELRKIHPDLVFEFSPIHESGIREFSISA